MSSQQTLESQWLAHQARYKELQKSFKRSCDSITQIDDPSERDEVMQSAKQKMHEIEDLLQRMKSDLRSLPTKYNSSKSLFTREWHDYSKQYSNLKNKYRKSAAKNRLLSMESHEKHERQRLLHHQDIYQNIKEKSQQSLQFISESETIGLNVSDNLYSQGKQLEKINIEMKEINKASDNAYRIMKTLKTKVYTDRLLQVLIVCVELVIIIFLLWWKLRKGFNSK